MRAASKAGNSGRQAVVAGFVAVLGSAPITSAAASYDTITVGLGSGNVYLVSAAGGQVVAGSGSNALLWSSSGNSINLNEPPLSNSSAYSTNGSQQVGEGTLGGNSHACLWNGTAASCVDLNPTNISGVTSSIAYGTNGVQQVGTDSGSSYSEHAVLWNGTANSAVDLDPSGFSESGAGATNGAQQVGEAWNGGYVTHAFLWSGTAASGIDLSPTKMSALNVSDALGVGGNQQVGMAYNQSTSDPFGTPYQAMLWTGTGASAVNLTPTTLPHIDLAVAKGTNGTQQVGYGFTQDAGESQLPQALLWSGTAASAVDLQTLLPTGSTWADSEADSIDAAGNIYGVGYSTTQFYSLEWAPVTAGQAVSISGTQAYHFAANPGSVVFVRKLGSISIAGGEVFVGAATSTATRQVLVASGGLTFGGSTGNWTGLLDIANNDLDLQGSPLASVTNEVAEGYSHGTWNGAGGIISAAAAADSRHLTAIGVIQNNQGGTPVYGATHLFDTIAPGTSDILVKYTYYGDANLDGKVDGSDYTLIDNGFNHHGTLTGWYNGDFNYDGKVDGSDYTLIDNTFNEQGAALSTAQFGDAQIDIALSSSVPEPASLRLSAIVGAALFLRRRQHRALSAVLKINRLRSARSNSVVPGC